VSYVAAVREAVRALEDHLGTTALLEAVQRDGTLRVGALDSKTKYTFHGIGCRVEREGRTVDFDFRRRGESGGFDAWRLWLFAAEDPTRFPRLQELETVAAALRRLHAEQRMRKRSAEQVDTLFYLAGEKLDS
jgi:hypothetical protein